MIEWAADLVAAGGYAGVFLLMMVENLFPPIPSEVIMPLAGFSAAQGHMTLAGVVVAGIAGSLAGNGFWFELSRLYGRQRMRRLTDRFGRWMGITPGHVEKAEGALRRNGPAAVCIARMMPGLRTAISVPAGLVELPRPVFYIWSGIGTGLWTGGLALAGYLLEEQFEQIKDWAGPVGLGVMLLVFTGLGWQVWKARRAG